MVFILTLEIESKISIFFKLLCELEYKSVSLHYSNSGEIKKIFKRLAGKSVLTKGYLNWAAAPAVSDLWKSFLPRQPHSLKIPRKYLDTIKSNSNITTETNITRSSPQIDLETEGRRDLEVLLSIFKSVKIPQSASKLLPHPNAMVCTNFPNASVTSNELPQCLKFACPHSALKHAASYNLHYSRGNKIISMQ